MATIESEIPVLCYELPHYDPTNPAGLKAKPMRPSPLEIFTGRFGRKSDKRRAREQLQDAGHKVHAINWGKHPETSADCLVVYIWAKDGAPPEIPEKPQLPPPRARRSATRRRSPRPKVKP